MDVRGKASTLDGKWLIYSGRKHAVFHEGCIRAASSFPAAYTPGCTRSQRNVMSLSAKAQEAVMRLSSRRKVAHPWLTLTAWHLTSEFQTGAVFSMLWSALQAFTTGTPHTTSSSQMQKLKLAHLASLLAGARSGLVLDGHWRSPAGIFTALPSAWCPEQV